MPSKNIQEVLANTGRVAFFLFWILIGFGLFFYYSATVLTEIFSQSSVVSLNKGAFYGLGVAIAIGALLFGDIIPTQMTKKPLSSKYQKRVVQIIVAGVLLTLVLPHIVHYSVAAHLERQGYRVCDELSHRWLFARTIVFTDSPPACVGQ